MCRLQENMSDAFNVKSQSKQFVLFCALFYINVFCKNKGGCSFRSWDFQRKYLFPCCNVIKEISEWWYKWPVKCLCVPAKPMWTPCLLILNKISDVFLSLVAIFKQYILVCSSAVPFVTGVLYILSSKWSTKKTNLAPRLHRK